ncbi:hypothetical protein A2U01_0068125, partial [Trifolium medium]|nr:hypothetical protein [Trifolium medium]
MHLTHRTRFVLRQVKQTPKPLTQRTATQPGISPKESLGSIPHLLHRTLPKPPAPYPAYAIPNSHNLPPPRRPPPPSISQPSSLHPVTSCQHPKP